ncbi:hypothetical protein ABES02_20300 [Neobacillus pocheonensis]|uniref:hypothetical protein n=1 Tax=Neobacillus pocheonensis TaxID=363869 RepID=UPI003D2B4190
MDKAIIFGVYDFVSFHICKTLLNKGIEVYGIQIEDMEKIQYLDEKRFEVGRNANFVEQSLSQLEKSNIQENPKTTLIFSFFDLYIRNKDDLFQEVTESILKYVIENKTYTELVFILPIQMLRQSEERIYKSFLEQIRSMVKRIQVFYLPSIYGPWQPASFMFQQAMMLAYQSINISKSEREWTEDTLFVGDAIDCILETMETEETGSYLLESGMKDYWKMCAALLNIEEKLMDSNQLQSFQIKDQIVKIPLKKITPISQSLLKQKENVEQLFGKHQ